MNEQECLSKMVAPGTPRPGKYRQGVVQIHITRGCDKSCWNCTQGSQLKGRVEFISPELFEQAVLSLKTYWGVVGIFGGNPALHPNFDVICDILIKHIPWEQRGLWCNNPMTLDKAQVMRRTYNPAVSNLNVHLDQKAYDLFKLGWPECGPVGLHQDSRHSPCYVALKDLEEFKTKPCPTCDTWGIETLHNDKTGRTDHVVCPSCEGTGQVYDEEKGYDLISRCPINQHWSAGIGVFRGELRAWFCEIAMAQSILHQDNPNYPDTGRKLWFKPEPNLDGELKPSPIELPWWAHGMSSYKGQVRKHCHECSVPLNGYGELAQAKDGTEQVSQLHQLIYKPKDSHRKVQLVTSRKQLEEGKIESIVKYIQNASK